MFLLFVRSERGESVIFFDQLSDAIHAAGFDAFAIMPATPLEKFLSVLKEARAEKRYPAFAHQDLEKRINPQAFQPSARSIISLAVSYYTGDPGPTPTLHGTVSRSAWGRDYHKVLGERMDRVIHFLREHCGAQKCTKAVDTSFLVDRAIAVESGLGYPGSNCAVYVPPFGSWVFLGEILVDVELPITKSPWDDHWSHPINCDACVRACPTQALFAPGKIKPQRCLSYLTQMTGPIPEEFREKLGTRLWGCDTCQKACPINRKIGPVSDQDFDPLVGPHVPLLPLLAMDKKEFEETYGQTSMAWRGKNVLQRNACVVLGNQGDPRALDSLEGTARNHPSPTVREAAQWATDKIQRRTNQG